VAAGAADPDTVLDKWQLCLSLAADLTTAVMQLGVDCAVPGYQDTSYQCLQLLVNLLIFNAIDGRAPYIDTDKHQRQLESVAYTLQLVEAAGRSQAASLKTMLSVLGGTRAAAAAVWHNRC
jgi:hypothetical protein